MSESPQRTNKDAVEATFASFTAKALYIRLLQQQQQLLLLLLLLLPDRLAGVHGSTRVLLIYFVKKAGGMLPSRRKKTVLPSSYRKHR